MTTLTAKYTMVVPEDARKELNLRPGMIVDLKKNERGDWVLVALTSQAKRWVGKYPSTRHVAEEMAELRGRDASDFD
jgi:bifunctional DNA-binding transcriptional regulator/antitoxin component of YhaV-PrlF toxin-antitoxin module